MKSREGNYHCPNCQQAYGGYHRCPEGQDRVEYVCIDCHEHVNRDSHELDIEGIAPKRCTTCTLDRMADP